MQTDVANRFKDSMTATRTILAPYFEKKLKCKFVPIEGEPYWAAKLLDSVCGCDYMLYWPGDDLCKTYANRVQFGDCCRFSTFTIRKELATGNLTELHKRKQAIKNGGLYPQHTCQFYVNKTTNTFKGAICKTVDLFDFVESREGQLAEKPTRDEKFLIAPWGQIKRDGYDIEIIKHTSCDFPYREVHSKSDESVQTHQIPLFPGF